MSPGPDQYDGYAAAQRAVARRLHPDVGGDLQEYLAAMTRLEQQFTVAPRTTESGPARGRVHVVSRRRVRSAVGSGARRAVATVRGALPRGWPGARRYGGL